jgi:LexA-binding, inner membrane-associated putative hydrolase
VDIVAHTLWASAGLVLARRRWPLAPRTQFLTLALAALPDIPHLLPVIGWWLFGGGSLAALRAVMIAVPGQEAVLPPLVTQWSWHLHCVMHSAVVAGAATLALWALRRSLWIPLLGWWSHIVIDVFTHSAAYYPAPVLYPFSQRGFDGLAWNTPWFLGLNYVVLAAVSMALWLSRRR